MATKARMVESRSHLRPNALRPQISSAGNRARRLGANSGVKSAKSSANLPKIDSAMPKLDVPAMLKPSVQPDSSPPAKEITSPAAKKQAKVVPLVRPSSLMAQINSFQAAAVSAPSGGASSGQASSAPAAPSSPLVSPVSEPSTETSSKVSNSFSSAPARPARSMRKMALAAVPGFFGLMGLGQLSEGKKAKGFAFLVAGVALSFISSWYIILPSRIDALLFGGTLPSAYSLSFLSTIFGSSLLASRISLDLLGVVMVLWGVQLFDAMGPIFAERQAAAATVAVSAEVPAWNGPALASEAPKQLIVVSVPAKKMKDIGHR